MPERRMKDEGQGYCDDGNSYEQNLDEIEELIQDWMSEADYVMRNRHPNEKRLPNDPVVIDVEQLSMD